MTAGGSWSEIELAGHPCDLFSPAIPHEHGFSVIYLHGVHLQRLNENAAFTAQFDSAGLRVIAPMTGRSWWTDRICTEFDERTTAERHVVEHAVEYLQRQWGTSAPEIGLLGTSMGGQGALRLAFKHPNLFPVVAAIAPAIDYYLRFDEGDETLPQMYDDAEAARQDSATLHVHPLNWPRNIWFACDPSDYRWWESADRLRMKLEALGIPHETDLETSAGGHGFAYYDAMAAQAVGFLIERLEQERVRVV